MVDINTSRSIIDHAITYHCAIWMDYVNNDGKPSQRVIEPLQWENAYMFRAFCHLRNEERSFKLANICEIKSFSSLQEALAAEASLPSTPPTAPVFRPAPSPLASKLPAAQIAVPQLNPVRQINTAEEWSRLIHYYSECLIRENQQQYVLRAAMIRTFTSDDNLIQAFLQGQSWLEFSSDSQLQQDPIVRFISEHVVEPGYKLCLGYRFLVVHPDEIAPLIYTPVTILQGEGTIRLQAEGFEASYAVLKCLQLTEEEIEQFLHELMGIQPEPGQSQIQALENSLLEKISEVYQGGIQRVTKGWDPGSLVQSPGLFWVKSNTATAALIHELHELASPSQWTNVSDSLKQLLNFVSAHDYPPAPVSTNDNSLYVTEINEKQVQAIKAAKTEPVVVVTGPPGTGKSQLVLNLIVQAYIAGESVLFASRNNRAVDVVMNRLQEEIRFPGCVRTGNTDNRRMAAANMKQAFNQVIEHPTMSNLNIPWEEHAAARKRLKQTRTILEQVRRLDGLAQSLNQELSHCLNNLPQAPRLSIQDRIPAYQAREAEALQRCMSRGFQVALLLKEKKTQIQEKVTAFVNGKSIESPLIRSLKKVEDQWGDFGQGFLHPGQTAPVAVLFSYLSTWFDLIEILTLREKKEQIAARQAEGEKKYMTRLKTLPSSLAGQPYVLAASLTSGDIPRLYDQFERLEGRFHRIAFGDLSLIERILAWLHLYDPLQKSAQEYLILRKELLLPGDQTEPEDILPPDLFELACRELKELVFAARDFQKLQDVNKELEVIQEQENKALMKLLPEIARDLEKVPIIAGDEGQARENLLSIQVEIDELSKRLKEETQGIMDWLHEAMARPGMISEFESKTGKGYSLLWQMPESFDPEDLLQLTTLWRTLATCWKTSNALSQVKSKLAELPTEAYVVGAVVQESKHLLELSGKVLRAVWEERVRGLDSPTIQSIYDYITAIEQMTNPAGTANYKQNKAIEGETLTSAIRAFPVWAATNLSSRTNFPLKGGFFDLVILDEASQCDFPSAIPLLYRAKRVVVIGDPYQLRHIATLTPESDQQLASHYGIAPEALSYNDHSLFDIAQRSVGTRPGVLLLNEHYRSHHRVIDFSNKEFYGQKLSVKTDLAAHGLPPIFIEECGGIFWMQVDGETRYPNEGSAVNEQEYLAIINLLPRLEASLKKICQKPLSIGIVTPYRAQEDSIKALLTNQRREGDDIMVGTAHKFQGDERDVMIFSTVLSRGVSDRSLNWLKITPNLLNVALTRARLSLIVVGDWDFCKTLPTNHVFRRLADYMNQQPERIVRRADDLPFFRDLPIVRQAEPTKQPNLEYSRITLRRFLMNCSRNIWWIDPDLNDRFMELFWDVFQEKNHSVSQVRLLIAQEQTQETGGGEPPIHPNVVRAFAGIASSTGIQFQVRALPKNEFPPSRMLFSNGSSYEMPPFAEILSDSQPTLEFARTDRNENVFLQLWERAEQK